MREREEVGEGGRGRSEREEERGGRREGGGREVIIKSDHCSDPTEQGNDAMSVLILVFVNNAA